MMGVSGLAGDPGVPPRNPPMRPLPLGRSGAMLAKAMNRLGWHWWPSDTAAAVMLGSVLTVLAPYLYLELSRRER
jgi:hypothetical protein